MATAKSNTEVQKIQNKIMKLNELWDIFKSAWKYQFFKDPFNPKRYNIDNLLPNSMEKQKLNDFVKTLAELHLSVKEMAYSTWFDRLYQFIETSLLKLHNQFMGCYFAFLAKPAVRIYRYNYFIYSEILVHNASLLQKDLVSIENSQKR